MPPKTLYQKIWDNHVVWEEPGQPALIYIDRHLIHEGTSPQAFAGLRAEGRKVRRPDLTFAVMDHSVPTTDRTLPIIDQAAKLQFDALEKNCRESGVRLFDMNSRHQGIVHIIGPELGITQPGQTIVCGDSHTSTHGAFGTLAFGIGTSEVEHVLATQCLVQSRSKTLHIIVHGKRPKGVTAKDIILAIIGKIGIGGNALGPLAVHYDVQGLRARLHQALRGKDVLDLAGADTEGQRAKGAVRGSVAVAADDGLPRLRDAQFRADDVHDALVAAVHIEQAHAGFAAVLLEGIELQLRGLVNDRQRAVGRWYGVVHHGECQIGAADLAAFGAETGKGLGRSALMDQVAVNVDERGLAGRFVNNMGVPDFLVESFRCHGRSSGILTPLSWSANVAAESGKCPVSREPRAC